MTPGQGHVALAIGGFLLELATPPLLGILIGAVAVHLLQRRGLRWTWALFGLPLSYLLVFVQWEVGLISAIATVTALRLGAGDHAEAVLHGGEEAQAMRDSRGPLRWALAKVRRRRGRAARLREGSLALGAARNGRTCRVPFGTSRGVHAIVLGATGSGKTVTQAAIAQAYVMAGMAAIVVDPKGDDYLRATLEGAAARSGARFRAWSPAGPTIYNPLARGNPTEIADKALAAHRWSEPHYELATQRLLGQVLSTMRAADLWPPTLSGVVNQMNPERLDALACKVGGETAERVSAYVDQLSARAKADLGGGRDRLAVLAEGELGPWLDPALGEGEEIDLAESLYCGDVLYFQLDADRYPAASKLAAAALLSDLVGLSAELQGETLGGLLVIDEFAALAAEQVSRLFARARSAGLSLLLGSQSLADLRAARPEDPSDTLTEQVLSNIEFAVVHRIGDPDSAERLAQTAGTAPAWSLTQRVSGAGQMIGERAGTRTRGREFLVVPDQFKRLGTGEAVVIDPRAKRPGQIVRVWPPAPS